MLQRRVVGHLLPHIQNTREKKNTPIHTSSYVTFIAFFLQHFIVVPETPTPFTSTNEHYNFPSARALRTHTIPKQRVKADRETMATLEEREGEPAIKTERSRAATAVPSLSLWSHVTKRTMAPRTQTEPPKYSSRSSGTVNKQFR